MRLTSFTDYSLRVLMYLAIQGDERVTIADIGSAFGISEHHLVKVVHFLGKAGFLANLRGRGGGLRLARPAASISIGGVVRQTEPKPMPAECFDRASNSCAIAPVCRLAGVLAEAVQSFYAVLDKYTLEDVVNNRRALAKILFVPPVRTLAGRAPVARR